MKLQSLKLAQVKIDGGTQSRAQLNEAAVGEYAEAIKAGAEMPAVIVYFDGSAHWLADGFHRFHAHRKAGSATIQSEVRTGTKRDAILHSVGANSDHGLRRTNEDKRRAVRTLLDDEEWAGWSDREIARACKVSNHLVADMRPATVTGNSPSDEPNLRKVRTKHGTETTMNVAPISLAAHARREEPPEVGPPAPRPTKAATAPTIESLQAENAQLREELQAARDNARELADLLESYSTLEDAPHGAAKEIARLKGLMHVIETQRDQCMTTCNELKRTVKARDRKI